MDYITLNELPIAVAHRRNFKIGKVALQGESVSPADSNGIETDGLSADWRKWFNDGAPAYVIYSYGHLVAWVDQNGQPFVPDVKHGRRVKDHQDVLATIFFGASNARSIMI